MGRLRPRVTRVTVPGRSPRGCGVPDARPQALAVIGVDRDPCPQPTRRLPGRRPQAAHGSGRVAGADTYTERGPPVRVTVRNCPAVPCRPRHRSRERLRGAPAPPPPPHRQGWRGRSVSTSTGRRRVARQGTAKEGPLSIGVVMRVGYCPGSQIVVCGRFRGSVGTAWTVQRGSLRTRGADGRPAGRDLELVMGPGRHGAGSRSCAG
jgi:hypothetical protein